MPTKISKAARPRAPLTVAKLLDELERFYGPQKPSWPVDPYEFIVWWQCGYPPSDAACARGWDKLRSEVGSELHALLQTSTARLASLLKSGGLAPEVRALRLKLIAKRVRDEWGGDLSAALRGPLAEARKVLKKFPGIAEPGADRILLFARIAAIAAVPSNCPHVLSRILHGREQDTYRANYRDAQESIAAQVAESFDARIRAYLLLKRHGHELCKRTQPLCEKCPIRCQCLFGAAHRAAP
jgi:endonuclease III